MAGKSVRRLHAARREDIADLVTWSPLPAPDLAQLDPFLLLNHHGPQVYPPGNGGLPFGPHPHRGFETVTFIVQGELTHRDSAGDESVIHAGGVQWMTAGRGLVHAEVSSREFKARGGPLEILQLWVNLPARLKMTTIELAAGGHARFASLQRRTVFLYVVSGGIELAGREVPALTLTELSQGGDEVEIRAPEKSLVLFGHADPIGEVVVSHGPFVMNTREEIVQAIHDYQAGLFGPLPA